MALGLLAVVFAACGGGEDEEVRPESSVPERIELTSPAFDEGATIPARFTCAGEDVSPPLKWSGVPKGADDLALTMEDPDAPRGPFVHWIVFGIDTANSSLPEGELPSGAREAQNSFGRVGYGGPCPPKGDEPHRYVFTLYALSEGLNPKQAASPEDVRAAIVGTAVARGELTGEYAR